MSISINNRTESDFCANFIHFAITPPDVQSETVEIPLRDGFVNLTPMLSSELHYNRRTITIGLELRSFRSEWPLYWSQMLEEFHGKEVTIRWSGDPDYYYVGVASVGQIEDHGSTAGVTITVDTQPFKRTIYFVNKVIHYTGGPNPAPQTYTIDCEYPRGYIDILSDTTGATATLNGASWTIPNGESDGTGLSLHKGTNTVVLYGQNNGVVEFRVRGGVL